MYTARVYTFLQFHIYLTFMLWGLYHPWLLKFKIYIILIGYLEKVHFHSLFKPLLRVKCSHVNSFTRRCWDPSECKRRGENTWRCLGIWSVYYVESVYQGLRVETPKGSSLRTVVSLLVTSLQANQKPLCQTCPWRGLNLKVPAQTLLFLFS